MKTSLKSFLISWAGYFGLFVSTARCPCCGQPLCPKGTPVMILLAALAAAAGRWLRGDRSKAGN